MHREYKFLTSFAMLWVTMLLVANMTALKTFDLFGLTLVAGTIGYPITYIFADIFTEVYGYKVTRKIIWMGLFCVALASFVVYLYTLIPGSQFLTIDANNAFNMVFKNSMFVATASIIGFWAGELTNSIVVAKMKIRNQGKKVSLRFVLSTALGQSVDTIVALTLLTTFTNIISFSDGLIVGFIAAGFCTIWEIFALPFTVRFVRFVKEKEGIDTYDVGTNFNPFKIG